MTFLVGLHVFSGELVWRFNSVKSIIRTQYKKLYCTKQHEHTNKCMHKDFCVCDSVGRFIFRILCLNAVSLSLVPSRPWRLADSNVTR